MIFSACVLLYLSIFDVRYKKIRLWMLLLYIVLGFLYRFVYRGVIMQDNLMIYVFGMMVGVILLGFTLMSHGGIGIGDSLVFIAIGMLHGYRYVISVLGISLILGMIYAVNVFLFYKSKQKGYKNQEIPFIPFIFLSFVLITSMQ